MLILSLFKVFVKKINSRAFDYFFKKLYNYIRRVNYSK